MAEYKNGKLQLPQVTLCAMTSVNIPETIKAIRYSMQGIDFGDVVLITHKKPWNLPKEIRFSQTEELKNIDDFNYKMAYELGEHIRTPFAMIVHADGFIVHPEMWRDEFLDYDYIGAPWPIPAEDNKTSYRDIYGNLCRVGNSVGIRSKRLMDFPKKNGVPWEGYFDCGKVWYNEDVFLCCRIRHLLEAEGMKIAPIEVAKYFGHENMLPETEGITPFSFHKWYGTNAQYPNFMQHSVPVMFMKRVQKKLKSMRNG